MQIFRLFLAVCGLGLVIACPVAAQSGKDPVATAREQVIAIVTVYVKPGQDEAFVKMMAEDVRIQAKHGVRLLGSYAIQFGEGGRHIDIWEGPSAEVIRQAFFARDSYPAGVWDIIERENIEIAVRNPIAATRVGGR